MATTPNFPATPRTFTPAAASVAVAVRTAPVTANIAIIATGAANGSRVDQVDFQSTLPGASVANLLRLWFRPNGNVNWFLLREVALPLGVAVGTVTNTATVRLNFDKSNTETPIKLAFGDALGFSVQVAEAVIGAASGWDY